jgi:hypothetical protein
MADFLYFVEDGEPASALRQEASERLRDCRGRVAALAREYGADGCMERNSLGDHSLHGFGFVVESGSAPVEREGLKFKGRERHDAEDLEWHCYVPDRRRAAGKKIAKRLAEFETFNFSGWVTGELGLRRTMGMETERGFSIVTSSAGIAKGKLILRIPVGKDDPVDCPPGFRQIKKSEFIALTEEAD